MSTAHHLRAPAICPKGTIQKIVFDPRPGVMYLCRDEQALLPEAEWIWGADMDSAYVFESYELAEAAVRQLQGSGETHVHAVVYGSQAASHRARSKSPLHRDPETPAHRLERHQQMLEAMHLE
jgi:hypothetical protein